MIAITLPPPDWIPFFLLCCIFSFLAGCFLAGIGWGIYWTWCERRERDRDGVIATLKSPRPLP